MSDYVLYLESTSYTLACTIGFRLEERPKTPHTRLDLRNFRLVDIVGTHFVPVLLYVGLNTALPFVGSSDSTSRISSIGSSLNFTTVTQVVP